MTTRPSLPASSRLTLLIAAGRLAERALERRLADEGLTLRYVGVLGHLSRTPGLSYSELARRAGVSVQAMHVCVRQLSERGLVSTVEHARGAVATLEVTPDGARALERFHGHVAAVDARLTGTRIDLEQLRDAVQALDGMPEA